jgi:hypothetical protein
MVVLASLLGAGAQLFRSPGIRAPRTRFDGAIVGVVALATGILVGEIRQIGPRWDGLYVAPAIFAAVAWALIAGAVLRYAARSSPEAGSW